MKINASKKIFECNKFFPKQLLLSNSNGNFTISNISKFYIFQLKLKVTNQKNDQKEIKIKKWTSQVEPIEQEAFLNWKILKN